MRVIILFTFFLAPLFGLASFPIENETTEFINEVYNQKPKKTKKAKTVVKSKKSKSQKKKVKRSRKNTGKK